MNEPLKKKGLLTIEEALEQVGAGANRYQIFCFIYFGLQWFMASSVLNSTIYLFSQPSISCQGNELCQEKCPFKEAFSQDYECQKFICQQEPSQWGNLLGGESIIMNFNPPLICSRSYEQNLLISMIFVGSLIGFFLFSFIADNYGRYWGLLLSWLSATLGGLLLGLFSNFYTIAIGLFLLGFGVNPAITIHYSFINEHTLGHFRDYQNIGVQVFYGVAQIALVAEGYYYENWQFISFYWIFIPILILNLPILLLQESPQFMYGKDKRKTVKILNKIAKFNGREEIQIIDLQKNPNLQSKKQEKTYSIIDLVRYKSLRVMFILGNIMFFAIQAVYYGINFALSTIGLNIYINGLIIAGCETLAIIISDYLIAFCSRKKVIVGGFFVASLLQIAFIVLNPSKDAGPTDIKVLLQIIFAGITRFIIAMAWAFIYVFVSEQYPLVVRSQALGILSASGTIGSIICPFIVDFSQKIGFNPLISMGVIGLIGTSTLFPQEDTFQQPLQNEIAELQKQNRDSQGYNEVSEAEITSQA